MIGIKDRGLVCRMAGNMMGSLLRQASQEAQYIDVNQARELTDLAISTACMIVEAVDIRLELKKP